MNKVINQYFDTIEVRLIQSHAVVFYQILRREIAVSDGILRVKAKLCDGGSAEILVREIIKIPDIFFFIDEIERSL